MSAAQGSTFVLASPTFVASDGETPEDCASLPTCTVTRDDGTALADATVTAADGDGLYTAAITTTHTSRLDLLHIEWTGTADGQVQVYPDTLEVAGGWYVTIPEVRAEPDLSPTAKYPVALIRQMRDEFEKLAEDYCGQAFVPRYERVTLRGDGSNRIFISRPELIEILSVTIDGVAQDISDFSLDETIGLVWAGGSFPCEPTRDVTVAYTHGHPTCPPDVHRACLTYLRSKLTTRSAGMPNMGQTEVVDGGRALTFAQAGVDRPTGIDSVDEVLTRRNVKLPGIA